LHLVRVVVTGGAGFIGSHIVDALLERGDEVVALDNLSTGRQGNVDARADLVVGDVRAEDDVRAAFEAARPDVCFHLAAQADVRVSVDRPAYDSEVNVVGTIQVLEAARRHSTQVVFASSGGAIYGEHEGPAPEGAPRRPLSPYGASKLAGEEYLSTYNRLYASNHVSLRLANVYGPRQDPNGEAGVVAIFLGRLARGERPHVFGDGQQTRDYVFVGDVARAALAAAGRPADAFNVGTGRETSVLALLEACRRVAGSTLEPVFGPARPGELGRSVLDPNLAARELGFRAETELGDGLAETWEFIRAREGDIRAESN
jgi:UDP-glucose 4-epimerase